MCLFLCLTKFEFICINIFQWLINWPCGLKIRVSVVRFREYKTNKSYFSRIQGLWSNLINRFSACFFQNSINSCFPWLRSSQIQRVGSLNPAAGAQATLPRDQTQQKCGLNWFKFLRAIRPGAVPCILVAAQALQKTHCHSEEQVSS